MTYQEYSGARMRYRAEQKARQRKHIMITLRKISGAATAVLFVLLIGKAGASDCGAAWEEIFPSTLYYLAAFAVCSFVWLKLGGGEYHGE